MRGANLNNWGVGDRDYPKDPAVLKTLRRINSHYRRINSLSVEISCVFSPGKQGVLETPP